MFHVFRLDADNRMVEVSDSFPGGFITLEEAESVAVLCANEDKVSGFVMKEIVEMVPRLSDGFMIKEV